VPEQPNDPLTHEVLALRLGLVGSERRPKEAPAVLAERLLQNRPLLGDRTAKELVAEALARWPEPLSGLGYLARRFIDWEGGRPVLCCPPKMARARRLLDEDLLLAARVVGLGEDPAAGARSGALLPDPWHLDTEPLLPALPPDLADILDRPLAETHLHLRGAAPPLIDWLPLMLDLVSLHHKAELLARASREDDHHRGDLQAETELWTERLAEAGLLRLWLAAACREGRPDHPFHRITGLPPRSEIRSPPASVEDRPDRARTAATVKNLRETLHRVGYRRPRDPDAAAIPGCPVWVDARSPIPYRDPLAQAVLLDMGPTAPRLAFALGERYLLASALQRLGEGSDLTEPLLRYLGIKSTFQRLLLYGQGSRGLDRFQGSFHRRKLRRWGSNRRPTGDPAHPFENRSREVWALANERYWTRLVTLRWLEASTSWPLLPGPVRGGFDGGQRSVGRSHVYARLPDLERKLELRVSPELGPTFGRTLHAQAAGIADALEELRQVARTALGGEREGLPVLPRFEVGIVFHLQKKREVSPEEHARRVKQILLWLHDHPAGRPLIVGLDAASSELDQPPSDFVPAFHHELAHRRHPDDAHQVPIRLGRTFHVGEDFRDLATGLRQIDLTLRLLRFGPGDRLGHALALGLDPVLWYPRQPEGVRPHLGDHLLDLLWAEVLVGEAETAEGEALAEIQRRLGRLLPKNPTALRRRAENWLRSQEGGSPGSFTREEELKRQLVRMLDGRPEPTSLHILSPDEGWSRTVATLQRLVAERVERAGLTIEANPTSNLLISGIGDYRELPLFRLHPVREGAGSPLPRLPVSISTDDPGLFQNGLREEYAALFETALAAGEVSRREVLAWLDGLRNIGYTSSFLRGRAVQGEHFLTRLQRMTGRSPSRAPR